MSRANRDSAIIIVTDPENQHVDNHGQNFKDNAHHITITNVSGIEEPNNVGLTTNDPIDMFKSPTSFNIQDEINVSPDEKVKFKIHHQDNEMSVHPSNTHNESDSLPSYDSNETIPNYENVAISDKSFQSYESTQNLTHVGTPRSSRTDTFIGIDNPAFHNDDGSDIHNNKFAKEHDGKNVHAKVDDYEKKFIDHHDKTKHDSNGTNGATNTTITLGLTSPTKSEHNGDTKIPEAVNLELVNMAPIKSNGKSVDNNGGLPPNVTGLNSIPVKKDTEVDLGGEHYDEYFVPVNEHRKYMRLVKVVYKILFHL